MVGAGGREQRFGRLDLGRLGYGEAYRLQLEAQDRVLASRERDGALLGTIITVEHDPVITVTRRPEARGHVLASPELLARAGVELVETDRGGDVTYHGPGQLVVYPIVDLQRTGIRLHGFMRLLEQAVINALADLSVPGIRDEGATGVWLPGTRGEAERKICAIGIRVSRWISRHGLALNVEPDLEHFGLIVPCGLVGRPVTSLAREGVQTTMADARESVVGHLVDLLEQAAGEVSLSRD